MMARPEKIKTPLGQRLSDARKRLGYDERPVFAEALRIPLSTLANYERGESAPNADVLAIYHLQFGINLNWLISGKGEMFVADSGFDQDAQTLTDLAQIQNMICGMDATERQNAISLLRTFSKMKRPA
jgi:transcriptional regulator with XRE-family HTH domain